MRLIFFCTLLVFLMFQEAIHAQKLLSIDGIVLDATEKPLIAATVVLLQLPDTTIAAYSLTSEIGKFQLEGKKDSSYLLQISYLGYSPYLQKISLDKTKNLDSIILQEAILDLGKGSIVVTAEHIPVQMRGDTLAFNAAAFHVRAHEDVEALLKQLPGLEIQEDGSITINGKVVTEILVDGKEFFGDNAQAVLKSLPADAIKKIEIASTKKTKDGVDTNNDEKTIDLKLKEEAKKGWLGNIEGGYGYNVLPGPSDNHRYKGGVSLNYFNEKLRFTVFGGINNTNEAALSFQQQNNAFGGNYLQSGVTRALAGGFNLNLFLSKKTDLTFSYIYGNDYRTIQHSRFRASILTNNVYTRNGVDSDLNTNQRHNFYARLVHKFDKTQKLRLVFRFRYNDINQEKTGTEETLGLGDTLQNSIHQNYMSRNNNGTFSPNIFYEKSFEKKKGREFSTRIAMTYSNNSNLSENNSLTNFYNDSGTLSAIDTLKQEQEGKLEQVDYSATITFKEPIGEKNRLEFQLSIGGSNSQKDRKAFDLEASEKIQNMALSDFYQKFLDNQELTVSFQRKTEDYFLRFRVGFQRSGLKGVLGSSPVPIEQAFYYPTGNLRFRYFITKSKKITFTYNTRFTEPKIEQLQPLINNDNPLSLTIGNPNLLPEYWHTLNLRTDLYEQSTFTNVYGAIYINFIQNTIIESQTLDANFRTTYQPINSGFSYRGGGYFGVNTAIKKVLKLDWRGGVTIYQSPIMINNELANQFNHNYNTRLSISNKKKEIVDASIAAKVVIGNSIYETNEALNVTYINHSYTASLRVTIAKNLNIKTNFDYKVYSNIGFENAIAIPIWSAAVNYTFLKNKGLKVALSAENLMNESLQVFRSSRDGIVSETQSNLLGRYFMLSVRYQIKK